MHQAREIVRDGDWSIDHCSCGTVHLHLNGVTVHLQPDQLKKLTAMMLEAQRRTRPDTRMPILLMPEGLA
jgi:hypothetical protein